MKELETLYELCDALNGKLDEYMEQIRKANGKLENNDVALLDKLAHAIKSTKTTIAMLEAEDKGYSGRYWDGRYYFDGEPSMEEASNRGSYRGGGGSSRVSYEGGSYARGRGTYANRDKMGRYAERGYSREDAKEDFKDELEELMDKAPDEQARKKLEKLMREVH